MALAVSLYRVLPRSVRGRVLTIVPLASQLRIARRLVRWPGDHRRARGRSTRRVRDSGRRVVARIADDATPISVATHNRDVVVRLLDGADVPYFLLPNVGMRSVVGVPAEYRDTVVDLVRQERAHRRAHVVRGGRPNRRSLGSGRIKNELNISYPVTDARGRWVLGNAYACTVEFWRRREDRLVAPGTDPELRSLPAADPVVVVRERILNPFVDSSADSSTFPTPLALSELAVDRVDFPIDAVYTWVDGADPAWLRSKHSALGRGPAVLHQTAASASRYASRDELRYSLRSVAYFAPWIRHIYLVTADQVPPWLKPDHPKLTIVSHREIFAGRAPLPTFNSHAIETQLHHIPDLAEHFLYFNDDMFLGRPVEPTLFFHANGIAKFFLSAAEIGYGPPTVADQPVNAAAKNNRRHIVERFGRGIATKMRHVPYPLRRSVLEEIEAALADEVNATASHQFRHPGDLSVPSSLHHYWAYATGRSVPGRIKYNYVDLAHPWCAVALTRMLRHRSYDAFCLNDTDNHPDAIAEQEALVAKFLPAYFPFRSPFERDSGIGDSEIGDPAGRAAGRRLLTQPGEAPATLVDAAR